MSSDPVEDKPAAKTTRKKSAAKKAAKKATKKVAAKKKTAKKAAKKAAKKTAGAETAAPAKKATKKKSAAKKKVAAEKPAAEKPAPSPPPPAPVEAARAPVAAPAAESNSPAREPREQREGSGGRGRGRDRDQRHDGEGRDGREGRGRDRDRDQRQDGEGRDGRDGRRGRRRRRGGPVRGKVRGKRGRGGDGGGGRRGDGGDGGGGRRDGGDGGGKRRDREEDDGEDRRAVTLTGPPVEVDGMLELAPKGFGFLRRPEKDFDQSREDVFLPPELVRKAGLRVGMWIHGIAREGNRGPQLTEITSINGMKPDMARKLPFFEELKATNPIKRIPFETDADRYTTRIVDMISPIGRGQRGLIVSPPRSGKTTLLLHLAQAVRERHSENLHLMILLVDERPEEVTEFKRQLPDAEIYASSNDNPAKSHCRLAELCIERAKRLVEAGQDVFLVLDSITRLARAYNNSMRGGKGRGYQSGGLHAGALEMPRRLFAAARNTRGGGSLTIVGTALVQTNAKADEAIFMEFKGTGNMELILDRKVAEHFIYPAVDIFKSGTRREELLLPEHMLHKIYLIRRGLSGHRPVEAMERLLFFLKKFPNNAQMLLEIKG